MPDPDEQFALSNHEGHDIVEDAFAGLLGASRYVPGNAWCLDCGCPVAADGVALEGSCP